MMSCRGKIRNERKHIKKSCAIKYVVCRMPVLIADHTPPPWTHTQSYGGAHTLTHPTFTHIHAWKDIDSWARTGKKSTLKKKKHPSLVFNSLQRLQRLNRLQSENVHLRPHCLLRLPWPQLKARPMLPSAGHHYLTPCPHRSCDLK